MTMKRVVLLSRIGNQIFQTYRQVLLHRHHYSKASVCSIDDIESLQRKVAELKEGKAATGQIIRQKAQKRKSNRLPLIELPTKLQSAIDHLLNVYDMKSISEESLAFQRYLAARQPPVEMAELRRSALEIEDQIKYNVREDSGLGLNADELPGDWLQKRVYQQLKSNYYTWKPIPYDSRVAFLYLVRRTPFEYAALVNVFSELKRLFPDFNPQSLMDFGSGVGSVSWAVNEVFGRNFDYHLVVENNRDMQTMARLLMQGGREHRKPCFPNVEFTQFDPPFIHSQESSSSSPAAADRRQHDIVVSAFSLLDLPSQKARNLILQDLWNKTRKFLVIVEQGNVAGSKLVSEARHFILKWISQSKSAAAARRAPTTAASVGKRANGRGAVASSWRHLVAPCPHELICPKFQTNEPCNTLARFAPIERARLKEEIHGGHANKEPYSYVIFSKDNQINNVEEFRYPRLVRQVKRSSGGSCIHCWLCMSHGKMEHEIFTKGKHADKQYNLHGYMKSRLLGDLVLMPFISPAVQNPITEKSLSRRRHLALQDEHKQLIDELRDENAQPDDDGSVSSVIHDMAAEEEGRTVRRRISGGLEYILQNLSGKDDELNELHDILDEEAETDDELGESLDDHLEQEEDQRLQQQ